MRKATASAGASPMSLLNWRARAGSPWWGLKGGNFGVHLDCSSGRRSDVRERDGGTLSAEAAPETAHVRWIEGYDPGRHRPGDALAGARPRHAGRQYLRVLRDAKVRDGNHGVAGIAGRSGARAIRPGSEAGARQ